MMVCYRIPDHHYFVMYRDRIVELGERDLSFIWLAKGQQPKRDAFYDFKGEKLTPEILDDLHYQFLRRLEKEGLIWLRIPIFWAIVQTATGLRMIPWRRNMTGGP